MLRRLPVRVIAYRGVRTGHLKTLGKGSGWNEMGNGDLLQLGPLQPEFSVLILIYNILRVLLWKVWDFASFIDSHCFRGGDYCAHHHPTSSTSQVAAKDI